MAKNIIIVWERVKDVLSWRKPNNLYQRERPMYRVQSYRSA